MNVKRQCSSWEVRIGQLRSRRPIKDLCLLILFAANASAAQHIGQHNWTCSACHVQQATQPSTSMAHALQPAVANPLFKTHPKMIVKKGPYTYTVETRGDQTTYAVSDGVDVISVPVHWVFGANSQTYVLERNGSFYESLVSYWKTIDRLDTTVGDQVIHPKTLEEAFGRRLETSEVTLCFSCHSTRSVSQHRLQLAKLTPGITCAHCHEGADNHLKSIAEGGPAATPSKLKRLSPEDISAFCGQCHRTWETVMRNQWIGPMNVRFQPYRLAISKCFDGVDRRLSCISCHDPHKEIVRDDRSYDANCLACHSAGAKLSAGMTAAHREATQMTTCPVSRTDCVSCHMPKIDLPGAPAAFTDHDIRVLKANAPYPH